MSEYIHEFRDPIHLFIKMDSNERKVVDSFPLQRLRHIHQLGLSHLVYPGATHTRFGHSLGVMDLAGRVFDVITDSENIHPEIKKSGIVPIGNGQLKYWKKALRMAALCHDLGHLPFSHSTEKENVFFRAGWNHERMTAKIIQSKEMEEIWDNMTPPLRSKDIVKLAVGTKIFKSGSFSDWEFILSEIIVGDYFGVDRMDYLLRDTYYAGVVYGNLDYHRLIDSIRILPRGNSELAQPDLGIKEGGLRAAEALLLARYFMYSQIYFHPVARIYNTHLRDFLKTIFHKKLSTDVNEFMKLTDDAIFVKLLEASRKPGSRNHVEACRITKRKHFKLLYKLDPIHKKKNPVITEIIYENACKVFNRRNVSFDNYRQNAPLSSFPVLKKDDKIYPSSVMSEVLRNMPFLHDKFVFISRDYYEDAKEWLKKNIDNYIISGKIKKRR